MSLKSLSLFFHQAAAIIAMISFLAATQECSVIPSDTNGCLHTHTAINKTSHFTIKSDGRDRDFHVYLPVNYQQSVPTPMILGFHGHNRNWDDLEEISRFSDPAINPDKIVVYPQGLNGSDKEPAWEGAPYAKKSLSDLNFTADLLEYMRSNYCINDSRIYASGKSNGGGFVDLLACSEVGADFAAFAPVSAALYTEAFESNEGVNCTPARSPLPIVEFHGTDDERIPYDGGANISHGVDLIGISTWLARWGGRNQCDAEPVNSTSHNDSVHKIRYTCNGVSGIVEGYKVDGQGHWWPSKQTNNDNNGHTAPVEASSVIMSFFNRTSKP